MKKYTSLVSIVIPAKNESKYIGNLLVSLLHQTVMPKNILVVDNGSTDNTGEIVKKFIPQFRERRTSLTLVYEQSPGAPKARNTGYRLVQSPIIAATDADTIAPDRWIESILTHFASNDSVAVHGRVHYYDAHPFLRALSQKTSFYGVICRLYASISGFMPFSTANCAIKKEIFIKSGGFNEHIINIDDLEDVDLALRISQLGKVRYDDRMVMNISLRRYKRSPITTSARRLYRFIFYAFRHRIGGTLYFL